MTVEDLISDLRERSITVSEKDGALVVAPASWLTPEEEEFLDASAAEIIAVLRTPKPKSKTDTLVIEPEAVRLIAELLKTDGLEARLERSVRRAAAATEERGRYSLFRTRRGLLHLEELNEDEARHLAEAGKLSVAEVRRWWDWRRDRQFWPKQARHRAFLLKARRSGFNTVAVHSDGRVGVF